MAPSAKPNLLNKKIGGVKGKWWAVGGVGAAGAAYFVYSRNAASTADTTTTDTTTDPSIDPQTGLPYASEEQDAYDQGLTDSYGGDYGGGGGGTSGGGSSPVSTGGTGGTDPVTDPTDPGDTGTGDGSGDDGTGDGTGDGSTPETETNQQWAHQAILALEAEGYSKHAARLAIHSYIAGVPLTTKEAHAVDRAVGKTGAPPEGHPGVHIDNSKPPNRRSAGIGAKKTQQGPIRHQNHPTKKVAAPPKKHKKPSPPHHHK